MCHNWRSNPETFHTLYFQFPFPSIKLKAILWISKSNDSFEIVFFFSLPRAISYIGCSRKINFSLNVLLWSFSFGRSLIMLAISCHFVKFLLTDKFTYFRYNLNIDVEKRFLSKKKLKCHSSVWPSTSKLQN